MNLYLDDMRKPYDGYVLVKTIGEAKDFLLQGIVENASLDHDLGACSDCYKAMGIELEGLTLEQAQELWLDKTDWSRMPNCEHFGTGYDLVCWMERTGHWPKNKPQVHSANPVGRKRMQDVINMYFA